MTRFSAKSAGTTHMMWVFMIIVAGTLAIAGCPTAIEGPDAQQNDEALTGDQTQTPNDQTPTDTASPDNANDGGTTSQTGVNPPANNDDDGTTELPDDIIARIGDMNGDGLINNDDVLAFAGALAKLDDYATRFPGSDPQLADCNEDGVLTLFDIECFQALLEAEQSK